MTGRDEDTGLLYWWTDPMHFLGVVNEPFTMEIPDRPETRETMPASALLFVPKRHERERPTFNKHSPVVEQAPTVAALVRRLERWTDENADKTPWELRLR